MRTRTIQSYGLTLSGSKQYLRVEVPDDDDLIDSLITASYEQVTAECNRDFMPTTYSMTAFSSSGDIFLSTQTVNSVSTGSLKEANGSWYTVITETYSGPITFTVADSGSLPKNIQVAMMMLVNHFYENRLPMAYGVSVSPISFTVDALCSPYKLIRPQ